MVSSLQRHSLILTHKITAWIWQCSTPWRRPPYRYIPGWPGGSFPLTPTLSRRERKFTPPRSDSSRHIGWARAAVRAPSPRGSPEGEGRVRGKNVLESARVLVIVLPSSLGLCWRRPNTCRIYNAQLVPRARRPMGECQPRCLAPYFPGKDDGVAQQAEAIAGGAARELAAPWRGHDVVLRCRIAVA